MIRKHPALINVVDVIVLPTPAEPYPYEAVATDTCGRRYRFGLLHSQDEAVAFATAARARGYVRSNAWTVL